MRNRKDYAKDVYVPSRLTLTNLSKPCRVGPVYYKKLTDSPITLMQFPMWPDLKWFSATSIFLSQGDGHVGVKTVRYHAHLSRITAIVRLCYTIRKLQFCEYTFWWENRIIGRSMWWPGPIGGAVPISTSGKRPTSSWPLYVTNNDKLCLGIRIAIYKYTIEGHSTSGSQPREKNLETAQNTKSIRCSVYMYE